MLPLLMKFTAIKGHVIWVNVTDLQSVTPIFIDDGVQALGQCVLRMKNGPIATGPMAYPVMGTPDEVSETIMEAVVRFMGAGQSEVVFSDAPSGSEH